MWLLSEIDITYVNVSLFQPKMWYAYISFIQVLGLFKTYSFDGLPLKKSQ